MQPFSTRAGHTRRVAIIPGCDRGALAGTGRETAMNLPRLYGELAEWWHVFSPPEHYEEEAAIFIETLDQHAPRPIRTVLELGSGGGNNASYMKRRYEMTLTDLSVEMLEQSRRLNPDCEHIQGDMRTLRLGRTFDAVFVHDAIAYMTTEEDLAAAMRTAYEHLGSPGIALFVPDDTTETIRRSVYDREHTSGDRSLHYTYRHELPANGSTTYEATFRYVLRDRDDERTETDVHTFGVFPQRTWRRLLTAAGFRPRTAPFRHSSFPVGVVRTMFVGLKV